MTKLLHSIVAFVRWRPTLVLKVVAGGGALACLYWGWEFHERVEELNTGTAWKGVAFSIAAAVLWMLPALCKLRYVIAALVMANSLIFLEVNNRSGDLRLVRSILNEHKDVPSEGPHDWEKPWHISAAVVESHRYYVPFVRTVIIMNCVALILLITALEQIRPGTFFERGPGEAKPINSTF